MRKLLLLWVTLFSISGFGFTRMLASLTHTDITVTSPKTRVVYQRNGSNQATITVTGTYAGSKPSIIQLQAVPHSGPGTTVNWFTLDPSPSGGAFTGTFTIGQGWWDFYLRPNQTTSQQVVLQRIGVGERFIVGGQSNSSNWSGVGGPVSPTQQTPFQDAVSSITFGGLYAHADDPQPNCDGTQGSAWPHFGDVLYADLQVPIAILCTGLGSTTVHQWIPSSSNYTNQILPALTLLKTEFRAFLWFQGESDAANGTSQANYQTDLRAIIAQIRTDAGWTVPFGVGLESYYPTATGPQMQAIIDAQTAVATDSTNFPGPSMNSFTSTTYRSNTPDFSILGAQTEAELWVASLKTYFGW